MYKLKNIMKTILCTSVDYIAKFNINTKPTHDSILLIRLDAIGDYILFRNFIQFLKESNMFKKYKITLVGNLAWKELALELDSKFVDHFIWINTRKFERNPLYRFKKMREIVGKEYEVVINPTYSRTFFKDDAIVKVVKAARKIGSVGNLSNMKKWQKKISDRYYDVLIPAQNKVMFEFYRNKEFFEKLLGEKLNLKKPTITLTQEQWEKYKKTLPELPKRYALIFIGAGAEFRKWSAENFAVVANYLRDALNYEIVLCGAKEDIALSKKFSEIFKYSFINLVGNISLMQLCSIIYRADLILSNETSVPHIAVALDKRNIFVISNGNHFRRFIPYPNEMTNGYYPIYHPLIERDLNHYEEISNSYEFKSPLNINDITPNMVIEKIKKAVLDEL